MANTKDRPTRSREGDLFGTFRRVKLARRRYPAAQLVACNADGQPLPQPEDTAAVDDQFRTAPHLALRPDSVGCCVLTLDRAVEPQKTAYRIYRRLRDHGWIVPVARLQDQPRGFQIWLRISDNGADGYWGTPKTGGRLVCHEPVVLYDDWMLRQSVAAKGLPTTTYARVCTLMKVVGDRHE